ncbi:hypothetical protein [Nocardia niigatensis]|uniref:hypothetical protein n=1 Tax=Nocardia niigatensis TaxID=209249 RepID=UPI0002F1DBA1|nr:hypothetical protein [Nocardia niigatensis]
MSDPIPSAKVLLESRLRMVLDGSPYSVRSVHDGLRVERPYDKDRTRTPYSYSLRLNEKHSRARFFRLYWPNSEGERPHHWNRDPDRIGESIKSELAMMGWKLGRTRREWLSAILGTIIWLALPGTIAAYSGQAWFLAIFGAVLLAVGTVIVVGVVVLLRRSRSGA